MEHSTETYVPRRPFLEYHFYKGGLRTEIVANDVVRPIWAPPTDWVGLNDEIALLDDDFVVEISKFSFNDSLSAWVGVYQNSPDKLYGDRNNHAGIGVWLPSLCPTDPALLIDGLLALLQILKIDDDIDFKQKSKSFLNDYLMGYLSSYDAMPFPISGLQQAQSQISKLVGFTLDKSKENISQLIDDLVFRMFFLVNENGRDAGRSLIHVTDRTINNQVNPATFPLHSKTRFLAEFVNVLPKAFEGQRQIIKDVEINLQKEVRRSASLEQEALDANLKLNEAMELTRDLEKQCLELKNSLQGNDEHRRHAAVLDRLSEINSRVSELSREFPQLKQSILSGVNSEVSRLSQNVSRPSTYQQNAARSSLRDRDSSYQNATHDQSQSSTTLLVLAAVVLFVLVATGIVYFVFQ